MAVAVAVSSGLASQTSATLRPGESVRLAGYVLSYDRLVVEPLAADPRVTEARAELTYSGSQEGTLASALRDYPNSTTAVATPSVRTALGEDLYVTLLAYDTATRTVTVRVFVNPLVVWIWVGGAIIGIGSAFAIWPERRRVPVEASEAERLPSAEPTPSVEGA